MAGHFKPITLGGVRSWLDAAVAHFVKERVDEFMRKGEPLARARSRQINEIRLKVNPIAVPLWRDGRFGNHLPFLHDGASASCHFQQVDRWLLTADQPLGMMFQKRLKRLQLS